MNSNYTDRKTSKLSKIHRISPMLLFWTVGFMGVLLAGGCTDGAAKIREQECLNISNLIEAKYKSIRNNPDHLMVMEAIAERNKLSEEYEIKCNKKK